MGKINVLITFLFITSNVFGQTFYDIALVEDKQGMNDIQNLTVNDINKKLSTYHYGFWTNDTLYVLSYRANDGIDWSDFAGADSDLEKTDKLTTQSQIKKTTLSRGTLTPFRGAK